MPDNKPPVPGKYIDPLVDVAFKNILESATDVAITTFVIDVLILGLTPAVYHPVPGCVRTSQGVSY